MGVRAVVVGAEGPVVEAEAEAAGTVLVANESELKEGYTGQIWDC